MEQTTRFQTLSSPGEPETGEGDKAALPVQSPQQGARGLGLTATLQGGHWVCVLPEPSTPAKAAQEVP